MEILRNAPNLSGAKPCPNCRAQIARDALLCIHCGYDIATGRPARRPGRSWKHLLWIPLLGAGIFLLASSAVRRNKPDPAEPTPPPPATPSEPDAPDLRAAPNARETFEAQKVLAAETFRRRLDAQEPLAALNEPVELRRANGFLDKGTLTGFAGAGTNRVALVATPTGEIGVPLVALDNPSRRRVDPEYREAFIQHVMSTSGDSGGQPPTE